MAFIAVDAGAGALQLTAGELMGRVEAVGDPPVSLLILLSVAAEDLKTCKRF